MSNIEIFNQGESEGIGLNDCVVHERLNDRGEVVMRVPGTVTGVNYRTQQVRASTVNARLRIWVPVTSVTANTAVKTAFAA